MTALLPDRETRGQTARSAAEVSHDLRHRRPLVLVAGLAGVLAAAGTLMVCLAVGVGGLVPHRRRRPRCAARRAADRCARPG